MAFKILTTVSARGLLFWVFICLRCATVGFFLLQFEDITEIINADGTINSTTWLYGSEVMPTSIRSKMVGVSAVAHYAVNVSSMYFLPLKLFWLYC